MFGSGKCKVCGCTEDHACMTVEGPCSWANEEEDLCSACVPVVDFFPQMHFYQCNSCIFLFGAEAAMEDQSQIVCPLCKCDEFLEDAGFGYLILTRIPEDEPEQEDIN